MPVNGVNFLELAKVIPRPIPSPSLPIVKGPAEVVVVPAQPEGFERACIGSNAWWAVRIAAKHRSNLRWIAAYQVSPIAAVTHIAELDRIEPFRDEGKFKTLFKRQAVKLKRSIPYGNALLGPMQMPRSCSKATFDKAKTAFDLVR